MLREVRECVPEARQANLVKSRVIRWPKATISPEPGVDALRPDQRSPISNLMVTGEWTQTGWPSTMEGAARSGYRAAEYILAREGSPQTSSPPISPYSPCPPAERSQKHGVTRSLSWPCVKHSSYNFTTRHF